MRRALWFLLVLSVVTAGVLCLQRNLEHARQFRALYASDGDALLEVLYPGLPGAVRTIRELGITAVHAPPLDTDIDLYQRLEEMLYPIEVEHVDSGGLSPGDIYAVAPELRPEREARELYRSSRILVLDIRP
jgi:hypothetical protein